ncbi:hypothetical protein J3F83DRAFT_151605 [Trichoderma novae-zelandiae]
MPRLLKKLKEKLSNTDANRDNKVHVSVQPDPLPVPNGSPPVPKPLTITEPVNEPKPLQGRLWNEAYELLKASNAELVDSYERILSRELLRDQHGGFEPMSLDNRIDAGYEERWKQMHIIVDAALGRQEERVARKQKIGGGLAAVGIVMRQAARTAPEAAVAWTGVCFAFEMAANSVQEAKANHEGMIYVASRMDWYWHLAELLLDDNKSESATSALRSEMEKHIVELYRKLLLYQMKSVCRFYRQHGPALWRDAIKADDWTGQLGDIRSAEAIVQEDSRVFNNLELQSRFREIKSASNGLRHEIHAILPKIQEHILSKEAENCLKDLRVTDPRDDKSRIEDTNGGLLQGAYDWAVKHNDFIAWRDEEENDLLWIKGDPGKGKTMLVCGIIEELQNRNIKPCYFFCQATDPRLNTATAVLRGLIYLLVDTNRQLLSHIQEKYDQAGTALFQDANSWVVLSQMFTKLLEEPSLNGQVFMIDGLDECQTGLERLLDLIVGKSAVPRAKWIVSSRNWAAIEAKLGATPQKIRFSLELNEQSVSEAVRFYISHKAAQLKDAKGLDARTEQKVRNYLTDNARGTFLWVALVCKELLKMGVRKRHVLRKMAEFPSDLGSLYERMMQQIRTSEDSNLCEKILKLVAVVYRPVTLAELASLLDVEDDFNGEDLEETVASCGSFLVVGDDVVRFVHQSAQDFLLKDRMFASGLGNQHHTLFARSLEILSATLRRDMYNLRHPGALIGEHTPNEGQDPLRHARYSCIYWVDHLKAMDDLEREKCMLSLQDNGIVHRFLSKKLLNWLEALSLMKRMSDAVWAVRVLRKLTAVDDCTMRNLIEDVYRFVLYHKVGLELAPLQVYSSALILSPLSSLVRQLYEETEGPEWIMEKPDMPSQWTARLQCLEGHGDTVNTLAFSPDGTLLASWSYDQQAKIWDLETAACLQTFDCWETVLDLAFSPDGKYLAAGTKTGVEVWDLMLSTKLHTFLRNGRVKNVAFSRDSTQLVAISDESSHSGFIRIWDPDTGVVLKSYFLGSRGCSRTAFTPDGTHLACVVEDYDTQIYSIWNFTTDRCLLLSAITPSIFGKLGEGRFSFDASRLAIGTSSRVYIFQTSTGECLQRLYDLPGTFMSLSFMADSTRLMSNSVDGCLRVWDTTTGRCLRRLSRGTRRPNHAAVPSPSPDGMLIADAGQGSQNNGIEIWDMAMILSEKAPEHSVEPATAMALSPGGSQLAMASFSDPYCTISIRDVLTGACLKAFPVSGSPIKSLAFFPDGKRLASGRSGTIEIWDVSSGVRLQMIKTGLVDRQATLIAVSSNGNLVAERLNGQSQIIIWDLTSTKVTQRFDHKRIYSWEQPVAAFSPDNSRLLMVSEDGNVEICYVNDGKILAWSQLFERLEGYQPSPLQLQERLRFLDDQSDANNPPPEHVPRRLTTMTEPGFKLWRTWILKGKQRVLWLPPEYRSLTKFAVHDGVVVIYDHRDKLDQALVFQFDFEKLDEALGLT